jgi:hypothetical protein
MQYALPARQVELLGLSAPLCRHGLVLPGHAGRDAAALTDGQARISPERWRLATVRTVRRDRACPDLRHAHDLKYAARQAHERASITVDRLQREVSELSERVDPMRHYPLVLHGSWRLPSDDESAGFPEQLSGALAGADACAPTPAIRCCPLSPG